MPKRTTKFQKLVFLVKQAAAATAKVTESKELLDSKGNKREVDVCIEGNFEGTPIIISIECKDSNRPANVEWVEQMKGKHDDLPTDVLILFSRSGFTKRAKEKAQSYRKRIVPLETLDETSAERLFGGAGSLWFKTYALTTTKVLIGVAPSADLPAEQVNCFPDHLIFNGAGEPIAIASKLVQDVLRSPKAQQDLIEISRKHRKTFNAHCQSLSEGIDNPIYLRKDDHDPPLLRMIESLTISGDAKIEESQLPLEHGKLENTTIAWGTVSYCGKQTLVVASKDETTNVRFSFAQLEPDSTKREAMYGKGLQVLPDTPELLGNLANFLTRDRKNDEAERLYRKALELDPTNASNTSNFALFIANVRKNYDEAERLFRKALELDSNHANHTGNFAIFLATIRKNYDEAERLFRKALQLDPNHATHTFSFAIFLATIRKNYDEAERLYRKALELDPDNANNIGDFARFMNVVRKNHGEAERLYHRALDLDPGHTNNIGNFALFLHEVRKDYDEAERLYRKALPLDPNQASNIGNFALFLQDVRKDYDEAERLYRRVLELDPSHANNTGNFAVFMHEVRKDYDEAERLYRRALELDPGHAHHTGNFAEFMEKVRKNYDEAERLYRKALELDPEKEIIRKNYETLKKQRDAH
jgi:tetratricopeptide (TPR) repeat protein